MGMKIFTSSDDRARIPENGVSINKSGYITFGKKFILYKNVILYIDANEKKIGFRFVNLDKTSNQIKTIKSNRSIYAKKFIDHKFIKPGIYITEREFLEKEEIELHIINFNNDENGKEKENE